MIALAKAILLGITLLILATLVFLRERPVDPWEEWEKIGWMGGGSKKHNKARMTKSGKTTAQLRVLREKFRREKK